MCLRSFASRISLFLVLLQSSKTFGFHTHLIHKPFTKFTSTSLYSTRRSFLTKTAETAMIGFLGTSSAFALQQPSIVNAVGTEELVSDLQISREKMDTIPALLSNGEWDSVRTILKTPPLNKLWNLGEVGKIFGFCFYFHMNFISGGDKLMR